jgi:hypothetical protein
MVSRIGDYIQPPQPKGESAERVTNHPDHKNRKGHEQKDNSAAEQDDGTFFSIDAIRALLKAENVTAGEAFVQLDQLQHRGVSSIPIRNEQSIIAAIADAAARL